MKVLVVGASGMAGVAVSKYFETQNMQVIRVTRKDFDISRDPFEKFMGLAENVDFVINCAGVIKPLISQTKPEDVLKVNVVFPQNLAKFCEKRAVPCFHLTTDCVYSGKKGNYQESDYFDAEDVYGMTKNGGEPRNCMTLRTSIIGEERGQGRSLIAWAMSQSHQTVNGFLNHNWNGVTTLCFAQTVHQIIKKGLYKQGLFHLHSPGTVSKYELLNILNEVYGLNLEVKPIEAPESCDRSLSSQFNFSSELVKKDIKAQVAELRSFFRENF
jgi:dTDP-4-dehydrorhamnose reductase